MPSNPWQFPICRLLSDRIALHSGTKSQRLRDRLVGYLQGLRDGTSGHAEAFQFASLSSKILIREGLASLKDRETERKLGEGSNWLRLRPPIGARSVRALRALLFQPGPR